MDKIFTFWTGDNTIPPVRLASLKTMERSAGVQVVLYTANEIPDLFSAKNTFIHPAYPHLNLAHRADYLRAFCMHHYGGGYADIKAINHSWVAYFEKLRNTNFFAIGYKESSRHHVANLHQSNRQVQEHSTLASWIAWRKLQLLHKLVIGNCAFICRPGTPLTEIWWSTLNKRLDMPLPLLEKNPAIHPKERGGHIYEGIVSNYPVPWTYLLGDILQPLSLKYFRSISRDLPPPDFKNYQ